MDPQAGGGFRGASALSLGLGLALVLTGCGAADATGRGAGPGGTAPQFARVSGDVVVTGEDEATVNLVFVAPPGDAVWSGLHELVVVDDSGDSGDLVFGPDAITVHPGTERGGVQTGSIPVTIPGDVQGFALTTVRVVVDEGDESVTYDVGDWRMSRETQDPLFSVTGDYPASMSGCGEVVFDVRSSVGADATVTGVATGAPGLTISDLDVVVDDSGTGAITFDLTCDEAYDVYAFSPTLIVEEEDGGTHAEPLDQILVGYLDMTEETVQQILAR